MGGPSSTRYDALGVGGITTLDFDLKRRELVQDFVSLNGTIVNCAGGIMYNNAGWLTCEETTAGPNQGWGQKHGYVFEVPHEALTVDPATGFVYLTEDQSGTANGFFRYRPNNAGNLAAGGILEMLKVRGRNLYDTREGQSPATTLRVEWVLISYPDPDLESGADSCAAQGFAQGADNLTVTPRGGLILCEDDASSTDADHHRLNPGVTNVNRLIGLTRDGEPFEFAVNLGDDTEFAGACFSPDGSTMFVNTFGDSASTETPGRTCAITGPWQTPL